MEAATTTAGYEKLETAKQQRLISLDAFRGFTIAAMIIVNDPGSWSHVYAPLLHAEWHGITPTDFIFPFFIFIVGVSIALSYTKQIGKGVPRKEMVQKIIKRSLIIFGLGIFLNLFPEFNFAELRVPGVLQRIAIVFLVCALMFLNTDWKTQAKVGAGILVAYWVLLTMVPVPGEGQVIIEPGRNWAAWLDKFIIPGKMWQGTWDPEGVLSTFPAVVTGIAGMLAGALIVSNQKTEIKVVWLMFIGLLTYALGNIWGWHFPINKHIWSSSFVLYTAGLASLTLGAFIWFVDILGYQKWTKIGLIFGANAITAYVIAGILPALFFWKIGGESVNSLFFNGLVGAGLSAKFVSMLWALMYCAICFVPVYFLYKKKIFIKV